MQFIIITLLLNCIIVTSHSYCIVFCNATVSLASVAIKLYYLYHYYQIIMDQKHSSFYMNQLFLMFALFRYQKFLAYRFMPFALVVGSKMSRQVIQVKFNGSIIQIAYNTMVSVNLSNYKIHFQQVSWNQALWSQLK